MNIFIVKLAFVMLTIHGKQHSFSAFWRRRTSFQTENVLPQLRLEFVIPILRAKVTSEQQNDNPQQISLGTARYSL